MPARTSRIAIRPRISSGSGNESAPPGVMSRSALLIGPLCFFGVVVVVFGNGTAFVDVCVAVVLVVVVVRGLVAVVVVGRGRAAACGNARRMSSRALE